MMVSINWLGSRGDRPISNQREGMVNDSQKLGRHTFLFPLQSCIRRVRVALFVVWGRVGSKRTLVEANVGNYCSIISLKVSIKSMAFKWTMASNGWLWGQSTQKLLNYVCCDWVVLGKKWNNLIKIKINCPSARHVLDVVVRWLQWSCLMNVQKQNHKFHCQTDCVPPRLENGIRRTWTEQIIFSGGWWLLVWLGCGRTFRRAYWESLNFKWQKLVEHIVNFWGSKTIPPPVCYG